MPRSLIILFLIFLVLIFLVLAVVSASHSAKLTLPHAALSQQRPAPERKQTAPSTDSIAARIADE